MLSNVHTLKSYHDNILKIYYIQACTPKKSTQFLYQNIMHSKNPLQTTKKSCILSTNFRNKSQKQLKDILLIHAKNEAVGELYGELIYTKSELKDNHYTSNQVRQCAIGSVRIKGNPSFYNGENFGEICSKATSYITQEDKQKFEPKTIMINNFCFTNTTMSPQKMKAQAKLEAYKAVVSKFKPSLHLTPQQSEAYIHSFKSSNEDFNFNTSSYCFDVEATLFPYELDVINKNSTLITQTTAVTKKVS
jgi:hypothetical protein